MSFPFRPAAAFGLLLALGLAAPACAEPYEALSTTAMGITGDIDLDDAAITFENGASLPFSGLVADHFAVDGKDRPASVYKVAKPADPALNGGNTLCGSGKVTYVANWLDDDGTTDWIAVFTGAKPPVSSDDLCASYTYVAKGEEGNAQ